MKPIIRTLDADLKKIDKLLQLLPVIVLKVFVQEKHRFADVLNLLF